PQEHRADRRVVLAPDLERAHDPIGLLLVRNVIAEAIAGRVILGRPAELGDPDLHIADAGVDHCGADIFEAPEVELAACGPAGSRARVIGPHAVGRVALAAGVDTDRIHA